VLTKKSAVLGLIGTATAGVLFAGTPDTAQADLARSSVLRATAAPDRLADRAPTGVAQGAPDQVTVVQGDHHRRRHFRHRFRHRHFRHRRHRHWRHGRSWRWHHRRHFRHYHYRHYRHYRHFRSQHFRHFGHRHFGHFGHRRFRHGRIGFRSFHRHGFR
jgi:hypothetical protein